MRVLTKFWHGFVIAVILGATTFSLFILSGKAVKANADPADVMKLGEFTTTKWFVRTGCVTGDPDKPNYITFSSIYIGEKDAQLRLMHIVDGKLVLPAQEDLRISVKSEEQYPYAVLKGNARQMFDMTVWNVQPDEQYYLFGQHIGSNSLTLLAKWSAAERNECGT